MLGVLVFGTVRLQAQTVCLGSLRIRLCIGKRGDCLMLIVPWCAHLSCVDNSVLPWSSTGCHGLPSPQPPFVFKLSFNSVDISYSEYLRGSLPEVLIFLEMTGEWLFFLGASVWRPLLSPDTGLGAQMDKG